MRYNKASQRILSLITDPVIPRRADGHVRLCEYCQRRATWAGGFIEMMTNDLHLLGRLHVVRENYRAQCAARKGLKPERARPKGSTRSAKARSATADAPKPRHHPRTNHDHRNT